MGTVRVAGWVAWVTGSAVGKPVKTADHYSNRKKNNKLATANLGCLFPAGVNSAKARE